MFGVADLGIGSIVNNQHVAYQCSKGCRDLKTQKNSIKHFAFPSMLSLAYHR